MTDHDHDHPEPIPTTFAPAAAVDNPAERRRQCMAMLEAAMEQTGCDIIAELDIQSVGGGMSRANVDAIWRVVPRVQR